jgi:hypothetical protein
MTLAFVKHLSDWLMVGIGTMGKLGQNIILFYCSKNNSGMIYYVSMLLTLLKNSRKICFWQI